MQSGRWGCDSFPPVQQESLEKPTAHRVVDALTLTNCHGLRAKLTNWGAGLMEMHTPDRHGTLADITLGFDSLDGYLATHPHFGVTTGRFANRIAHGKFQLDGVTYTLTSNNGPNHLHGGPTGFHARFWNWESVVAGKSVRFSYTSADGEEGFPGTLEVAVTYTLTEDDELRLDYEATTDRATVLNLTNHAYWNLAGASAGSILNHEVKLPAKRFVPVDAAGIPVGRIEPVAGGSMDFTTPKTLARDFAQLHGTPGGYDHCYVIDHAHPGRADAGGGSLRTGQRPRARGLDHGAGHSSLHGQFSRRVGGWQRREGVPEERWVLSGDAAFSGFAKSSGISEYGPPSRTGLPQHDGAPIFHAVEG